MVRSVVMNKAQQVLKDEEKVKELGDQVKSMNDQFIQEQNVLQEMPETITPDNKLEKMKVMRQLQE